MASIGRVSNGTRAHDMEMDCCTVAQLPVDNSIKRTTFEQSYEYLTTVCVITAPQEDYLALCLAAHRRAQCTVASRRPGVFLCRVFLALNKHASSSRHL